ncbi:hypothetical protein Taro_018189, partial [Colocasia esculenta]|nr:hypothetical protein [Colocasia esculenta]
QFGDDSEVDDDEYEVEVLDVKPFAFAAAKTPLGRESAADADSVQSGQHTALQFTVTSRRQARAIAVALAPWPTQTPCRVAGALELMQFYSIIETAFCNQNTLLEKSILLSFCPLSHCLNRRLEPEKGTYFGEMLLTFLQEVVWSADSSSFFSQCTLSGLSAANQKALGYLIKAATVIDDIFYTK